MNDTSNIIFTKDECSSIISYASKTDMNVRGKKYESLTTFKTCKLNPTNETNWIFDKIYKFLEISLNLKVVQPLENLMINRYDENDLFAKHQDLYFKNQIYNVVVNLNNEYAGGDFVLYEPDYILKKNIGNACIFEYTRWHEVKKIESGHRWSMIAFFLKNNVKHTNSII